MHLPNKKHKSNSYKYIDPDFTYTDPKTGLLRNLLDITDPDVLLFVDSGAVIKRVSRYIGLLHWFPKYYGLFCWENADGLIPYSLM